METKREWTPIKEYEDILFDYYNGIARITINRERYRNAFTPTTTGEMSDAMRICREEPDINVVVLTGAGDKAFCSGGDQNVKGRGGYIGKDGVPRLSVLDVQKQIRSIPKPVIAAVNGFAIGGGHVLHVVCDLSIASENAIFGQTGPRVGSFDAGFGSSYLARVVGQKKAREIWFLCRKYNAQEALDMGLVNKVVPLDKLEDEYVQWAEEMMQLSPLALRMIKAGLNAELDGQAGIQELAGDALCFITLPMKHRKARMLFWRSVNRTLNNILNFHKQTEAFLMGGLFFISFLCIQSTLFHAFFISSNLRELRVVLILPGMSGISIFLP